MSHDLLGPVRRHRTRLVASLTVLLAAGAGLVVVPTLASAAPTATVVIHAGRASMAEGTVPAGLSPTKYAPFVFVNTPFTVHFTLTDQAGVATALSTTASTKLTLSIDNGRSKGQVLGTVDVEPAATEGDIAAPGGLPTAANAVSLKISAKGSGVTPGTTTVDVVGTHVASTAGLTGIGAGGGEGVPCSPTATLGNQTCGDLVIPAGTSQLLTQGLCTTTCKLSGGSVLQWLAPGVDRDHPVTFIAKCDKSLCAGKGVNSYHVFAQTAVVNGLGNPVAPSESMPCLAKGVVNDDADFCTDYVQSKRDGAGDVLLYVLFAADAKIIW